MSVLKVRISALAGTVTMTQASMLLVEAKVLREGQFVHLVIDKLTDLSAELAAISDQEAPFPFPQRRGENFIMAAARTPAIARNANDETFISWICISIPQAETEKRPVAAARGSLASIKCTL